MKRLLVLFLSTLSIAACTSTSTNNSNEDTAASGLNDLTEASSSTVCFQKLDGNANQDTSFIQLVIEGEQVSGEFSNKPFEKDSRVGKIQATKKDDLIKGVWVYMQEGMHDTLEVEFKLSDDKLIQKNYTIDAKTGREVFSDGSVFNVEFKKVDCTQ